MSFAIRIASRLVVERDRRQHRTEDLLPRDPHLVRHGVEDRRLDEVAAALLARRGCRRGGARRPPPAPTRCSRARGRAASRRRSRPSSSPGRAGRPGWIVPATRTTRSRKSSFDRLVHEQARARRCRPRPGCRRRPTRRPAPPRRGRRSPASRCAATCRRTRARAASCSTRRSSGGRACRPRSSR